MFEVTNHYNYQEIIVRIFIKNNRKMTKEEELLTDVLTSKLMKELNQLKPASPNTLGKVETRSLFEE